MARPDSGASGSPALPDDLRYLVIEGVIGAGKTTLARMLAERLDGRLVLERFEENPFLERFYEAKQKWAFQTQLAFLASRFQQQRELASGDLFHRLTVSDYSFDKDRIFAHHTLSGDELQLYETLYRLMEPNAPVPDLVLYLHSSPERLLKNIAQRGRSYERDIDPAYIRDLHAAYTHYFQHYRKSPLLVLNASEIDFVEHDHHFDAIVQHVATHNLAGTTYCSLDVSASRV
jgi:deoxyadenosine/deoxycytidine kinase